MNWWDECERWLDNITYRDNYRLIRMARPFGFTVRVACQRPDRDTGEMGEGLGGLAHIMHGTPEGAVVQQMFGLFRAYDEHECRESFKYEGLRLYDPHMTLEALKTAATMSDTANVS